MERLIQYLDDLEDLFYAAALKAERIRQFLQFCLFMAASTALQLLGVFVALRNPPVAVAMASLLLVGMLFHAAVGRSPDSYSTWESAR
jgi:membrane protein YdbS with pleckstrin-like domain